MSKPKKEDPNIPKVPGPRIRTVRAFYKMVPDVVKVRAVRKDKKIKDVK